MYLRMSNNTSQLLDGKKQTSVSHSSTESEVVSLDAGMRMDGIPALDLWDVVIGVLTSSIKKNSSSIEVSGNRIQGSSEKLFARVQRQIEQK